MLTRRALLYRTAHAFAGAALASMMRWWPKQEEETLEISASIGTGYTTLTVAYLDAYGDECSMDIKMPADKAVEIVEWFKGAERDHR